MTRTIVHRASFAGAAALIALTAGCGIADEGSSSSQDKAGDAQRIARGVVSKQKASQLLDRYVSVNNRANKARDGKLLSTVEGGALLEQSKAGYAQYKVSSAKEKAGYGIPFYYVDRQYLIPRQGTASWFAVSARIKDREGKAKLRSLLVFDHEEGEPWKIVASVLVPKKHPVAPARDKDGFVQTVAGSAQHGAMAPEELKDGLQKLYTERDVAASGLKPNKLARDINTGAWNVVDEVGEGGTMRWLDGGTRHTKTYPLKMRSGQVYAVFNTPVDRSVRVTKPGYSAEPNKYEQIYVGEGGAPGFMNSYLHQSFAVIPVSGKPELLSTESMLTGAVREDGF